MEEERRRQKQKNKVLHRAFFDQVMGISVSTNPSTKSRYLTCQSSDLTVHLKEGKLHLIRTCDTSEDGSLLKNQGDAFIKFTLESFSGYSEKQLKLFSYLSQTSLFDLRAPFLPLQPSVPHLFLLLCLHHIEGQLYLPSYLGQEDFLHPNTFVHPHLSLSTWPL